MLNSGFLPILLACALYGILHSILASSTIKSLAARRLGQPAYQRFYRLFFVLVASITALPLFILVPLLPDLPIYRIPAPWLYLTLLLQALAALALLAGVLQTGALSFLGLRQLAGPPGPEPLIVTGLYRWVRHPLYTASFVILWLTPLMTWNVLALNLGLSAYMVIGTIFEEKKLVQQFGQEYETYRRRTPRLIPRLVSTIKDF